MEDFAREFAARFSAMHPLLAVALISALPWIELRGGIPVGVLVYNRAASEVLVAALVGNFLAVLPVIVAGKVFQEPLERWRYTGWLLRWSLSRARRHEQTINRYGWIGLAAVVAIPLPGTGAWTGTFVSILVGMRLVPTIGAIVAGLAGSAAIVLALTLAGKAGFDVVALTTHASNCLWPS